MYGTLCEPVPLREEDVSGECQQWDGAVANITYVEKRDWRWIGRFWHAFQLVGYLCVDLFA